ncbi:MAG: N-6 DNA methylase [Methanoregula sp.]
MPDPEAVPAKKPDAREPGRAESALLHDLTRWREALARSIARNNLELRSDQITTAVNRILFPLLLLRIAEDRHIVKAGMLDGLSHSLTVPELISHLAPYADALYSDLSPAVPLPQDPGSTFIVGDRVVRDILEALISPSRRYDFSQMTLIGSAGVLMQYLARTIRRSAAHQATVADTHDTVVSGGTIIPPPIAIDYLATEALASAMKNRSAREILPLRVFDPACGSGQVLVAVYLRLLEHAGGPALTSEERRDILANSVYGLDASRHAVAVTRMLLFLQLCEGNRAGMAEGDFLSNVQSVLRVLRHTILCGNALVGPEIARDESWMFCPARDRHSLNPFSYADRFPEIFAGGGFDAVVCNPPEGALEQREWIQQYFQRRYAVYHPTVDRSAYFMEKAISLVRPGGGVSFLMNSRWIRGAPGSSLREMLAYRQIGEIVLLSPDAQGKSGTGLCLVRVLALPVKQPFRAVHAGAGFSDGPAAFCSTHGFPVDPQLLDKGGWTLSDTRSDRLLQKLIRCGTPLGEYVMEQVHTGIRVPENDPLVIDEALAKEWLRQDPRSKPLIRRLIAGTEISRFSTVPPEKFLIHIPRGWTVSHQQAVKKPWQWLKHRHPLIARHIRHHAGILESRAGPESLWWESATDEFWQEPKKKIIFPSQFTGPAFLFDTGRGIGDENTLAIPSSGHYLAGILNSRLIRFVFERSARLTGRDRTIFTWDDLHNLPIYTPDFDRPEDRTRHDRVETLVRRIMALLENSRAAKTGPECEALQNKIRAADAMIDALVYDLYGLTTDEIGVIEGISPSVE